MRQRVPETKKRKSVSQPTYTIILRTTRYYSYRVGDNSSVRGWTILETSGNLILEPDFLARVVVGLLSLLLCSQLWQNLEHREALWTRLTMFRLSKTTMGDRSARTNGTPLPPPLVLSDFGYAGQGRWLSSSGDNVTENTLSSKSVHTRSAHARGYGLARVSVEQLIKDGGGGGSGRVGGEGPKDGAGLQRRVSCLLTVVAATCVS
ncbi:hypothetical protein J6590_074785 [Homalodisca vitripennis]|nr:hypothetical protein J6590_074785 [Homalodisca vitripennis]